VVSPSLASSPLAPPERALSDGVVWLRFPSFRDARTILGYAQTEGGLDGTWLPSLAPGAPKSRCQWLVQDWLNGWAGRESHNGPALVVDLRDGSRLVGVVGFGAIDRGTVELSYGIAPAWRGRGLATRAARLATRWLIEERGVREVELHIALRNLASRRVAAKAGFRLAGRVPSPVETTREVYEDLRYVFGSGGPGGAVAAVRRPRRSRLAGDPPRPT
jgi:RimJ/RimL family protein N-acetyltransferase